MCNGRRNVRPSITWKLRRKASSCPSRNNAMVAMKSSHKSTQQGIVQEEETVRFVWKNIKLVYLDARSEGRMTVKMMMIQENTWVIPRQNDEPYAIRTALGWCVFGPIKAECHNAVSCNWIAVVKVDSGKMAEHHFEREKGCKDIGIKKYMRIKGSWKSCRRYEKLERIANCHCH